MFRPPLNRVIRRVSRSYPRMATVAVDRAKNCPASGGKPSQQHTRMRRTCPYATTSVLPDADDARSITARTRAATCARHSPPPELRYATRTNFRTHVTKLIDFSLSKWPCSPVCLVQLSPAHNWWRAPSLPDFSVICKKTPPEVRDL